VDDYISSYQSSGRPPPPVPQEPTDETQRKALGLLPLFKPQSENTLAGGLPGTSSSALGSNVASSSLLASSSQNTSSSSKIVNPADIPIGQEFKLYVVAAEKYHNIGCMPEYEGFSPEVRYCLLCMLVYVDPKTCGRSFGTMLTSGEISHLQSQSRWIRSLRLSRNPQRAVRRQLFRMKNCKVNVPCLSTVDTHQR